ncbi:MAG TPA: hypothetical protein VHV27_08675 [Phenylobacterium sp.]|nr:hypothetical protein [Phenylobacterium sp.]
MRKAPAWAAFTATMVKRGGSAAISSIGLGDCSNTEAKSSREPAAGLDACVGRSLVSLTSLS